MSKPKKKRVKKYDKFKAANNVLVGTIIEWTVDDPLAEDNTPLYSRIRHRNPVQKTSINGIKSMLPQVVESMSCTYHINIELVFNDTNGRKYYRGGDLVYTGAIDKARDAYYKLIEDCLKESNRSHYVTTNVTAEIKPKNFRLRDVDTD